MMKQIERFCGPEREVAFYNKAMQDAPVVHFMTGDKTHRLLNHFYSFLHFTDPKVDNHYKRFVRDWLHYKDSIFCAAGKIIAAIQNEAMKKGLK